MKVGYRLYREIADLAPADLTSGELVVAWVIADDANDGTRRSWIALELLCYRTRLKPSSVRAALAKLAARGYEFRVIHGYGRDGRPVFAARGHATDYVVPDFTIGASPAAPIGTAQPAASAPGTVDNSRKGASTVAPNAREKALAEARKALEKPPKGASRLAPLSSDPLNNPSTNGPVITPPVEVSKLCTSKLSTTHLLPPLHNRPASASRLRRRRTAGSSSSRPCGNSSPAPRQPN